MGTKTITKDRLKAAMLRWEQGHRAGETLTYEQTQALPAEQVAEENANHLWTLLEEQPVPA